jgi:hypothetical protein
MTEKKKVFIVEVDYYLSELVERKASGVSTLPLNEVQDRLLDIRNELRKAGYGK